jgi:hypothetical protein
MITIAWNLLGFHLLDALPKGNIFNAKYCRVNILTELLPVRPQVDGSRHIIHAGNAKPHTARKSRTFCEENRHDVSPDDVKQYFETLSIPVRSIRSAFVWNKDETRVKCPKETSPPELIVALNTKLGSVTIPEVRDDAQLTLLRAISGIQLFLDSFRN